MKNYMRNPEDICIEANIPLSYSIQDIFNYIEEELERNNDQERVEFLKDVYDALEFYVSSPRDSDYSDVFGLNDIIEELVNKELSEGMFDYVETNITEFDGFMINMFA